MIILNKGERADPLYGMQTETITDKDIEALKDGKRLYFEVNMEYAVVIKYKPTPHGFTADEWYRQNFKDGEAE